MACHVSSEEQSEDRNLTVKRSSVNTHNDFMSSCYDVAAVCHKYILMKLL